MTAGFPAGGRRVVRRGRGGPGSWAGPIPCRAVAGVVAGPARHVRVAALAVAAPVRAYVGEATGLLLDFPVQFLQQVRKRARGGLFHARVRNAHFGISPSGLIGPVRISLLSGRPVSLVPRETPQ